MKDILIAENLGIKFYLNSHKRHTVKNTVSKLLSPGRIKKNAFWALKNISFKLEEGKILGVIGKNGAGKSTLLRTLGGIYKPDEGYLEAKGTISTLLSLGTGFQGELSGAENIYLSGVVMGFTEQEVSKQFDNIVKFSELGEFIDQPVKTYSSGMYARLGFSIAMHLKRDIMLIDEVLGVGDESFKVKSHAKIKELLEENRTFVIVSHSLPAILQFSHKVLLLEQGKMVAFGKPQEMVDKYLGEKNKPIAD